jgi:hypothetical protein
MLPACVLLPRTLSSSRTLLAMLMADFTRYSFPP